MYRYIVYVHYVYIYIIWDNYSYIWIQHITKNKFNIFVMNEPQIRDLDAPLTPPGLKLRSAPFSFKEQSKTGINKSK